MSNQGNSELYQKMLNAYKQKGITMDIGATQDLIMGDMTQKKRKKKSRKTNDEPMGLDGQLEEPDMLDKSPENLDLQVEDESPGKRRKSKKDLSPEQLERRRRRKEKKEALR